MGGNLAPDSRSGVNNSGIDKPALMGILNITPDSFYAESRYSLEDALTEASSMIQSGATWLDIGGESTRPGAETISIDEEIERVIPVIKEIHNKYPEILISVDTRNHQVARLAIENGAEMVNDVSGLRDQKMVDLVLE